MTTDDMDKDLERFTSFDKLSERVGYWTRRFDLTRPTQKQTDEFNGVVAKHSRRVIATMRAG